MRCYIIFLCTVLLVIPFAGCAPGTNDNPPPSSAEPVVELSSETPSEPSASMQSSSSQEEPAPSPLAALKIPGEITVYKIYEDSGIFEPYKIPIDKSEVTLFDIAAAVEKQLEVKIPIKSITQRKGMVVVDIAESFIDSYGNVFDFALFARPLKGSSLQTLV